MNTVIDAGVFVARAFLEPLAPQCAGLIEHFEEAHAVFHEPHLFRYELVAVCRKIVYRKRASTAEARKLLNALLAHPIRLHFDDELLLRSYELAEEYNLPTTYDAQYLALAERLSCEFWTLDERLFNALNNKGPAVRWVGNWQEA